MNFTASTPILPINLTTLYYVVGGIVFKVSTFGGIDFTWSRYADAIIHESGRVLKNRTSKVNFEVLTKALQQHALGQNTDVQIIEMTQEQFDAYDADNLLTLVQVAASVKTLYN